MSSIDDLLGDVGDHVEFVSWASRSPKGIMAVLNSATGGIEVRTHGLTIAEVCAYTDTLKRFALDHISEQEDDDE